MPRDGWPRRCFQYNRNWFLAVKHQCFLVARSKFCQNYLSSYCVNINLITHYVVWHNLIQTFWDLQNFWVASDYENKYGSHQVIIYITCILHISKIAVGFVFYALSDSLMTTALLSFFSQRFCTNCIALFVLIDKQWDGAGGTNLGQSKGVCSRVHS